MSEFVYIKNPDFFSMGVFQVKVINELDNDELVVEYKDMRNVINKKDIIDSKSINPYLETLKTLENLRIEAEKVSKEIKELEIKEVILIGEILHEEKTK